MKMRHVFSTPDIEVAQRAIAAARRAGVEDEDILLVARSDIELDLIPDKRKEADTDLIPAAVRGAGYGGATGLLAGLLAITVPPLGVTLAGAAAAGIAGAMIGGWASALVGATVPDPIRRQFEEQIDAGNILVVISAEQTVLDAAGPALESAGAVTLPYSTAKAAT